LASNQLFGANAAANLSPNHFFLSYASPDFPQKGPFLPNAGAAEASRKQIGHFAGAAKASLKQIGAFAAPALGAGG
jgi:hypothetical protein